MPPNKRDIQEQHDLDAIEREHRLQYEPDDDLVEVHPPRKPVRFWLGIAVRVALIAFAAWAVVQMYRGVIS